MSKVGVFTTQVSTPNKGLNFHADPEFLDDAEVTEGINFDIVGQRLVKRAGLVRKATGVTGFGANTRIVGYLYKENTFGRMLASTSFVDNKMFSSADGGVTWAEVLNNAGSASMAISAGKGVQYDDKLYVGTLADGLWSYNNDNKMYQVTNTPNGWTGDIVLDRMFVWDPTTQTIRYNEPGKFTGAAADWPATNSIKVGGAGFDGDLITSLVGYKERLIIFKQNSIWVLFMTGSPVNWQLKRFIDGIGCTGMFASVAAEDYVYFIGQRGVYRTNLSTIEEVSTKLGDPIFADRGSLGYTTSNLSALVGSSDKVVFWNGKLICLVNVSEPITVSPNSRWFIYNTRDDTWMEWTTSVVAPTNLIAIPNTRTSTSVDNFFPQGVYMIARDAAAAVYHYKEDNAKIDVVNTEYECSFTTKRMDFERSDYSLKKVPRIYLEGSIGASVGVDVHYLMPVNTPPVLNLPAGTFNGQPQKMKVKGPGYTRTFQVKFVFTPVASPTDRDVTVRSWGIDVRTPRPQLLAQAQNSA